MSMHTARDYKLCPWCTPLCTAMRPMRAMRSPVSRCGMIIAWVREALRRIKSPQLYRLSYQPYRSLVCFGLLIVSVVYPGPIARAAYHGPEIVRHALDLAAGSVRAVAS